MKKRGRPPGPDIAKLKRIFLVLKSVRTWIWVSQIARIAKMKESTTRYYINKYFLPFIEEMKPFDEPIRKYVKLRLVRLKNPDMKFKEIIDFHKMRANLE
ncbi:MAG TPA: hypothetical protein ENG45_00710 [Candidatus Aenigmarchaeota archaeon]|nr:hypothetical protein [Candidatus Aenigmarchaeota archaeon]